MRLLVGLVFRVVGVVLFCLVFAAAWVMVDVNRNIQAEVTTSADRVVTEAVRLAWREMTFRSVGPAARFAFPDWRSSDALRVISPGYCVSLAWGPETPRRLCGGWSNVGGAAPEWFQQLNQAAFGPIRPVRRSINLYMEPAGVVVAEAEEGAAARQAWRQVSVVVGVAAAMAAAIGLLATLVIGHALMPAETIVRSLRRLEAGDHSVRLPAFRAREFAHIARAVNDLTDRLARTTAQRAELTLRLFQVQEEERRALARDLHDEFGQCLTATAALGAAVAARTERDRPDVAEDAREIGAIADRMMSTLKSTLSRLRPPDLDDIGLERSLDHLVATWNARLATVVAPGAPAPVFRLDIVGSLAAVPPEEALSIYRIAQECLTNAAKHSRPSEVRVRVESTTVPRTAIALTVEDDGGGDPARLVSKAGRGLLGIRERIAALGGSLSMGPSEGGVRIAAIIPLHARRPALAAAGQIA